MWERLKTSKTVWLGIGGILVAVGSYLSGALDAADMTTRIVEMIALIFLRDGIAKAAAPKAPAPNEDP